MLDVCVLGTSGMMPLPNRYTASLLLRYCGELILIDCGEGTQIPFKLANWGFKDLSTIFLTHFHADHTAGLPGLLLTLGNSGKREPIHMYGPKGLIHLMDGVRRIAPELPYTIHTTEISTSNSLTLSISDIKITTVPLNHKLPCLAYVIDIHRKPKFNPKKASNLNIPVQYWNTLQNGTAVSVRGKLITPDLVTEGERKGLKLAYCVDTRPINTMVNFFKGADLLICEGIYPEEDKLSKAKQKKHMIFSEAAHVARDAGVKELWLTHFSPSVKNPKDHEESVGKIFENTKVARDLMKKTLRFENLS